MMGNVTYLHAIARRRAAHRAWLLQVARPTLIERIVYFFRMAFK